MSIESWMTPEEVADLAAHASAVIDAALVGTDLSREVFWPPSARATTPPTTIRRSAGPAQCRAGPVTVQMDADSEPSPALVAPAIAAAEIPRGLSRLTADQSTALVAGCLAVVPSRVH